MGHLYRKAVWTLAAIVWLLPAVGASAHGSNSGKTDSILLRVSSSGGPQRVIIRTKPGAQTLVRRKLEQHGERVDKVHKLVHALSARVSPRRLAELAADPDVESISSDAFVTAHAAKNAGSSSTPTVQQLLGIGNWFPASTVSVAVIDSGIAPGPDFDTRIMGFHDFSSGRGGVATAPYDDYGHGTHVAGLIGSRGTTSNGAYAGVAPGVKLVGVKVLDRRGIGRTSEVLSALEFVVANKDRYGIKVINLSLGHPVYESAATDPLVQAVEAAVRAGLIVVVSAGNYGTNPTTGVMGYGGITSPGNAPSAITVGAANTNGTVVRTDDRVPAYSSRGPSWFDGIAKPDVVAPAHGLISNSASGSTLERDYPGLVVRTGTSTFMKLTGSSMGTAVVTGMVAVMLDANEYGARARYDSIKGKKPAYVAPPSLSANALKAMLQYSSTPLRDAAGVAYNYLTQGTGLVNGMGAAILAYSTDTTKPVGTYWAVATMPPVTRFDRVDEGWSQMLIWGTRAVRGGGIVEIHQSAWDENIVWGTGAFNIVWGTFRDENIVWGTSLAAGGSVGWSGSVQLDENIVWGTFRYWDENIVWGTGLLGYYNGFNIVWGTVREDENIVWGTLDDENIVWGTSEKKVTVVGLGGVL